jgi:hypothetical protein
MQARALVGALLALFVLSASAGCNLLYDYGKKKIEQKIAQEANPGDLPLPSPVQVDLISVNSVTPNRGEIGGGMLVEIIGLGFVTSAEHFVGAQVYFGDALAAAQDTTVVSDDRIQTITPPDSVGVVHVKVLVQGLVDNTPQVVAKGQLDYGFEYYEPVGVTSITPSRGPTVGGTKVLVQGAGFVTGTAVKFGNGASVSATLIDSGRVEVTTPRLLHAVYDVTVANPNGAATLPDAFSVYEVVRVRELVPFSGPLLGGTSITVRGTGFVAPSTLTLGGVDLANVTDALETEITATTAAAVPPIEGAVDATVTNESGTATLKNGFVFIDTTDSTPRVIAVTPSIGLIAGGNIVHIAGVGFADGAAAIVFDAESAICQVLSDTELECVVPPHAEGTVDVRVTNSGADLLAANAYTYVELRADVVLPDQGAVAGGTYVVLYGSGFGGDTDVTLADAPARDIDVLDPHRVAFRTPPGALGLADLRVIRDGLELDGGDLFTYFDPINTREWSSGGPIDGSVNVTAIDGDGRLEGAFAMLGTDPTTPYQGFTNARGQITFSGPDVVGLQTVSAGKAGHTNFSWIDVDAQNLLMWTPKYPAMTPGTPSCGAHPPIVRGNVTRIKDEYNFGNDYVQVTTSYASFSFPLPDPGPNASMINQGAYELRARTGDMVVMALAGTDDGSGNLKVHAMGFHPYMFTEGGSETVCGSDADCAGGERCFEYGVKNACGRIVICRNDNDCADGESCVPQGPASVCARADSCCLSNDNCTAEMGELCMVKLPDKVCTKVYDGIDITIDTPLKQQMRINLDDPPLAVTPADQGFVPDETKADVWYDFGYMGLHPMASLTLPATDVLFVQMPVELPGGLAGTQFKLVTGTYLSGTLPSDTSHQAQSEVFLENLVDTTLAVDATPFLGTQREVTPTYLGFVGSPMQFEFTVNRDVLPSAYVHALYSEAGMPTWLLFAPRRTLAFDLPVFPTVAADVRQPSGTGYWQLYGMYSPGALFNHLDPDVLFSWRSRAIYLTLFSVP